MIGRARRLAGKVGVEGQDLLRLGHALAGAHGEAVEAAAHGVAARVSAVEGTPAQLAVHRGRQDRGRAGGHQVSTTAARSVIGSRLDGAGGARRGHRDLRRAQHHRSRGASREARREGRALRLRRTELPGAIEKELAKSTTPKCGGRRGFPRVASQAI